MKKLILVAGLTTTAASHAGPYADIAKAKFESRMKQAIRSQDIKEVHKNSLIATLSILQKDLRGVVSDGLKENKSCLKIKQDFIKNEKTMLPKKSSGDADFDETLISAPADYLATVCLDMK